MSNTPASFFRSNASHLIVFQRFQKRKFRETVFEIVRRIPRGKTMTYTQVAEAAGRPRAYRAVGNLLATNFNPKIPCHRVIRSDGTPGGYNRGAKQKIKLLKNEQFPKSVSCQKLPNYERISVVWSEE